MRTVRQTLLGGLGGTAVAAPGRGVRSPLQGPSTVAARIVRDAAHHGADDAKLAAARGPRSGWYYRHGGRVYGPLTLTELAASCRLGFIAPDDPVCFKQASAWSPCRAVLAALAAGGDPARRGTRPAGFALVDFLLLLGICLAAVIVLVPAIHGLRERASRDGCAARMREVARSLLEYERTNGTFPTGIGFNGQDAGCPEESVGMRLWTISTLPFLGHADVAALIHPLSHNGGWVQAESRYDPDTVRACQTRIPEFECPADSLQPLDRSTDSVWRGYSRSNVVGCFSPHGFFMEPEANLACLLRHRIDGGQRTVANPTVLNEYPLETLPGRAMFNLYGVDRSLATVTDGQSQTVMLSEVISGGAEDADGQDDDIRGTWSLPFGLNYSHYRTPNSPQPDLQGDYTTRSSKPGLPDLVGIPGGWPAHMVAARSRHRDGVNVACVDGSVRFVTDSVDPLAWRALGSMDGGDESAVE